jgi:hypothetical protein
MQIIHAQNEQTDKYTVSNLIADKILNSTLDLELKTTDEVQNQNGFRMLNI